MLTNDALERADVVDDFEDDDGFGDNSDNEMGL